MNGPMLKGLTWLRSQPGMDEPLVRWGLVISAAIILWAFAVMPYLDWRGMQQDLIETRVNKVLKLKALKSSSAAWKQAQTDTQKEMGQLSKAMFQGSSYADAQASVLKSVTSLLRAHHLKLDSQRLLDEVVDDVLGQKIGVFLRVSGKQLDVMHFMHAMAQLDKLIVLERLYINQQGGNKAMMLQFQASGFRLSGAK